MWAGFDKCKTVLTIKVKGGEIGGEGSVLYKPPYGGTYQVANEGVHLSSDRSHIIGLATLC